MADYLTANESARFKAKYVVDAECWIWQGSLDRDGYGAFHLRGSNRLAHRVGWFSVHGEIPKGHVVNHTCRRRSCVNPSHLNCITARENALRDSASRAYVNSQKTHCPNGHPYDDTETSAGRTSRICTTCRREKQGVAKKRRYALARASLSV